MTVQPAAATTPAATAAITTTRAYLQLILTVGIWGGYFVVAKKGVDEASPLALSAGRYVIGGAILLGLALRSRPFPRPSRREWVLLGAMGFTSVFGFNVLSFIAFELAPASDGALIMPTMPTLFILPLAALLFGEHPGRWQFAGLALLLLGEFFVFREALFSADINGERLGGIALFFTAAFLWAIYTLCARALGGRISPIHATLYAVALGAVFLIPIGAWPLANELRDDAAPGLLVALFYLGALQTVVGLIWWFQGVQAIGAARAAVINTLVPVVALVLAAFFLNETPGPERIAGAALVVAGVGIASVVGAPVARKFLPP
ncbi:MAG: DMT family transporter [Tepidiformaceae bacterium]